MSYYAVVNGTFFEKTFGATLLAWSISKVGLNADKELQRRALPSFSVQQHSILTEVHKLSVKSLGFHFGVASGIFGLYCYKMFKNF
jgi:hypothetical protein